MDTRRVFWLCLGWFGFTQAVHWALQILRVDVWPGNAIALAANALIVVVAAFALVTEADSGPTERDLTFWAAVAAAVLGTLALLF